MGEVGSAQSDTSDSESETETPELHLKLTDSTVDDEGKPDELDLKPTESQVEGETSDNKGVLEGATGKCHEVSGKSKQQALDSQS